MKKIIMIIAMFVTTLTASAQFEEGMKYIGTSFTNAGLNYNGAEKFNFGLQAKTGFFITDYWQINASIGFDHRDLNVNSLQIGAGLRYYIIDNGLFIGAGAKAVFNNARNDVMPGFELGYAFFINESLTIEPAVVYDQSFSNHSDYSTIGLKIGLGYYF